MRELKDVQIGYEIVAGKLKLWACDQKTGQNVLRIQTYGVEVKTTPVVGNQQDISIRVLKRKAQCAKCGKEINLERHFCDECIRSRK